MATLMQPKEIADIKKLSITELRDYCIRLSNDYTKIVGRDVLLCGRCGEFYNSKTGFYTDKKFFITEKYPVCKKCIQSMVEQTSKKNDIPNETRKSVQFVLRLLDKPYLEPLYAQCIKETIDGINERVRTSPFAAYITAIQSLPQYRGLTFDDSEFPNDDDEDVYTVKRARKEIKKIFGLGLSEDDYLFLQDQYDDFRARTQVDSKSQEVYVTQICLQLLDIDKDRKNGRDVTSKLKSLDTLMNAANLQPKQNVANAATDALTFGQLIEKWELEKPIPEPDPEFKDVDGIGKYIRVWFTGWLSKALGLKGGYTQECEDYIREYTVNKYEAQEDGRSDDIYDLVFGNDGGS